MDVPSEDIVSAADAHIQRVRIQAPAVAHEDLLARRPHRDGDDFRPAVANAFEQCLALLRGKITVLAADDVHLPALTQPGLRLRQDLRFTTNQKHRCPFSASALH